MLSLTDNRKIGMLLASLGLLFLLLGVILFFDTGLLAIGNILFISSIPFLVGFRQALNFFNPVRRKERRRGIICFFIGVFLVLIKWAVIGMIIELIGIIEMFGVFLPYVIGFVQQIPYIGPLFDNPSINRLVHWVSSGQQRRPPPV